MKKIMKLILFGLVILTVAGCNIKNRLVCTSENSSVKQKYLLKYSEKEITKIEMKKKYTFDNDDMYDSFGIVMENYSSNIKSMNNKDIIYKNKKTDDSYTIELVVDMKKVTDEQIKNLGFNKNLDDFKNSLESQGLVCK